MAYTVIPRADWPRFVEAASQGLTGTEVSVEIHASAVRTDAWAPLLGLTYDIGEDVLWIHTGHLEHEVTGPRELRSVERGGRLEALEIDGADARWVLRFRVPVAP